MTFTPSEWFSAGTILIATFAFAGNLFAIPHSKIHPKMPRWIWLIPSVVEVIACISLTALAFSHFGLYAGLAYLIVWWCAMVTAEKFCLRVVKRRIQAAKKSA